MRRSPASWLPAAACVLASVLLTGLVLFVLRPDRDLDGTSRPHLSGSSYADTASGYSGLYRLAARHRDAVERWSHPLTASRSGGTLVVADPARPLDRGEQQELLFHLEGGGTVLYVDDELPDLLVQQGLSLRVVPLPRPSEAMIPARLADPAAPLRGDGMVFAVPRAGVVPLYGSIHGYRAALMAVGQGRLVLVTDPSILSNAGLQREGNLRFAWRLVHGLPTPLRFDEYHHGFEGGRSLLDHAVARGWLPALVICLLLGLVSAWHFSSRPPPPQRTRLSQPEGLHPEGPAGLAPALAADLAASGDRALAASLIERLGPPRGPLLRPHTGSDPPDPADPPDPIDPVDLPDIQDPQDLVEIARRAQEHPP